jgi:DNA anti-recombination protein RmuC
MGSKRSLADEIQQIRDRLLAMRTEREAAMHRLAASREHAEARRQVRAEANPPPPDPPPVYPQ